MQINKIHLKNFRNHSNRIVEFGDKSTVIIGNNGIGKTNILEAIHLLSTTKSLRTTYDREMISHEENASAVTAVATIDLENTKLEMTMLKSENRSNASSKRVKINGVKKTLQDFSGKLNSVLFSPSDIEVFAGSPSNRRKYIDSIFFQIDLEYKRAHSNYTKAVRQRNKVLENIREYGKGRDLLKFWDDKIIETGQTLQRKRTNLFNFINENIMNHAKLVNGEDAEVIVDYEMSEMSEERIAKYKDKEIASARTLVGPHKDDFKIKLNGYAISSFGSRGQQRSTLLALKLCEIDFLTEKTGHRPILLLDDIFSELDDYHKEAVENIMNLQQTIITSAEETPFLEKDTFFIRL